jgi:RHS repeat-associated protein
VRNLTDTSGAVTDQYSYSAFGELQGHTGTSANAYLFAGQQFDSQTGLYDLRARYYAPTLGRFTSADTLDLSLSDPSQIDRYVYTAADPINHSDPGGHFFFDFAFLSFQALAFVPQPVLGAVVGAEVGSIFGGAIAAQFYTLALSNLCGSDLYGWARQANPEFLILDSMNKGWAAGAVFGALNAVGPVTAVVADFLGISGGGVAVIQGFSDLGSGHGECAKLEMAVGALAVLGGFLDANLQLSKSVSAGWRFANRLSSLAVTIGDSTVGPGDAGMSSLDQGLLQLGDDNSQINSDPEIDYATPILTGDPYWDEPIAKPGNPNYAEYQKIRDYIRKQGFSVQQASQVGIDESAGVIPRAKIFFYDPETATRLVFVHELRHIDQWASIFKIYKSVDDIPSEYAAAFKAWREADAYQVTLDAGNVTDENGNTRSVFNERTQNALKARIKNYQDQYTDLYTNDPKFRDMVNKTTSGM